MEPNLTCFKHLGNNCRNNSSFRLSWPYVLKGLAITNGKLKLLKKMMTNYLMQFLLHYKEIVLVEDVLHLLGYIKQSHKLLKLKLIIVF